jgi:hypothetical protein
MPAKLCVWTSVVVGFFPDCGGCPRCHTACMSWPLSKPLSPFPKALFQEACQERPAARCNANGDFIFVLFRRLLKTIKRGVWGEKQQGAWSGIAHAVTHRPLRSNFPARCGWSSFLADRCCFVSSTSLQVSPFYRDRAQRRDQTFARRHFTACSRWLWQSDIQTTHTLTSQPH